MQPVPITRALAHVYPRRAHFRRVSSPHHRLHERRLRVVFLPRARARALRERRERPRLAPLSLEHVRLRVKPTDVRHAHAFRVPGFAHRERDQGVVVDAVDAVVHVHAKRFSEFVGVPALERAERASLAVRRDGVDAIGGHASRAVGVGAEELARARGRASGHRGSLRGDAI